MSYEFATHECPALKGSPILIACEYFPTDNKDNKTEFNNKSH
jgi:hypothetical protein